MEDRGRSDRYGRRRPDSVDRLLAGTGTRPDAHARPSHVCHRVALQERCGLRTRKSGAVAADESRHDGRRVGLRPHHHLEFSAICFAEGGRSARLGGADSIRHLDFWTCTAGGPAGATQFSSNKHSAQNRNVESPFRARAQRPKARRPKAKPKPRVHKASSPKSLLLHHLRIVLAAFLCYVYGKFTVIFSTSTAARCCGPRLTREQVVS